MFMTSLVLFCRISVVFRVRSARAIKISDADLIKRLCGIVLIFAIFLSVRMVVGRPEIVRGECYHDNDVLFFITLQRSNKCFYWIKNNMYLLYITCIHDV